MCVCGGGRRSNPKNNVTYFLIKYVFEYSNAKVFEYIKANNAKIMAYEADKDKEDWMQSVWTPL